MKFRVSPPGLGQLPHTFGLWSDVMKEFLQESCCHGNAGKEKRVEENLLKAKPYDRCLYLERLGDPIQVRTGVDESPG